MSARTRRSLLWTGLLTAVAGLALAPAPVEARRAPARRHLRLRPTPEAADYRMRGSIVALSQPARGRDRIVVRVESRGLPPGTVLAVYYNNFNDSIDPIFLTNIVLEIDDRDPDRVVGFLDLKSWEPESLPESARPVREITRFSIVEPGSEIVLMETRRGR